MAGLCVRHQDVKEIGPLVRRGSRDEIADRNTLADTVNVRDERSPRTRDNSDLSPNSFTLAGRRNRLADPFDLGEQPMTDARS